MVFRWRRVVTLMVVISVITVFLTHKWSTNWKGLLKTAQRRHRSQHSGTVAEPFTIDTCYMYDQTHRRDCFPASSHLKTILLWTNYYSIEYQMNDFETNKICPNSCFIPNDRRELQQAATVLFHSAAWDLSLEDLPMSRHAAQRFVYFNQEAPPKSSWKDLQGVWAHFPAHFYNWTMTYRMDSDIVVPYDRLVPKSERISGVPYLDYSWPEVKAAMQRKTKMGLQFVSNCYSESGRETIVRALQRYVSIDQFGYCVGRACDDDCEQKILPEYRFFIAFENNICRDYVTEKFWRLKRLIVPVVLRASTLEGIAPNDSYIAVDQFDSIAALGEHLLRLSRNDYEYLQYFEWTRSHQATQVPREEAFCQLCDRLHQEPNTSYKSYANLSNWWYPEGMCELKLLNFIKEYVYMWGRFIALCVAGSVAMLILLFLLTWKYFVR